MKLLRALPLMILASLGAPALAQPGETYQVQLSISDGGRVIGRPSMTIRAGAPGRITLPGVYDLSLRVQPSSDQSYPVSLATTIALPVSGELVPAAEPSFRLRLDQPASYEMVSQRTSRTLRVEAMVSQVPELPSATGTR